MITPEQMHQMVLFAQATTRIRQAAEAGVDVTLSADEARAMIFGINLVRVRPEELEGR